MDEDRQTLVIIPTYNEAYHIVDLASEISRLHPRFHILIVDDNSPDGTGKLADRLAEKSEKIKVLHQSKKSGLGRAYVAGFKYALSNPFYAYIVQMDADFSHDPKYLGSLLKSLEENDVVLGSRYIPGGVSDWNFSRRMLSCIGNSYVRFILGLKIKDCTGGFRCFKREVLNNINIEGFTAKGYLFQIEVLFRLLRSGYKVKEVPITFIERKKGRTKLGFSEVKEAIFGVPKLRFYKHDGLLAACGIFCLAGFIYLYGVKLFGSPNVPVNSVFLSKFIGWGGVLLLNLLIFAALFPLLTYRISFSSSDKKEWKSKSAFIAFFVALFTEMFGFSLAAYIFSPFFEYPYFKQIRDGSGLMRSISVVAGGWIVFFGILLVFLGWQKLHKSPGVATTGLYKYVRHPQYTGFFLIIIGWCIFWPTLLTVLIMPIMLVLYFRLAKHEETDLGKIYKNEYIAYKSKTPAFLPRVKFFSKI